MLILSAGVLRDGVIDVGTSTYCVFSGHLPGIVLFLILQAGHLCISIAAFIFIK